ncbi:rhomboid family intramembrane serine protease [Anaeropeptidivorans aminofermentans]|jgi:membrane associated rhomboid family serine protease|uniref:rhomboid family intramembrane serine protease n=1 Tax=Anaeropeptidivorans aminofermentans TaxID=2934315 RepID=UPI0020242570|nr:rhomboid family intramembrane serine protease [Anaeropeptidivorans aminofermentans]
MKILRKIQYNSPVILTFTLLSFIALLLGMATKEKSTYLLFSVYKSSFSDPLSYFRVFTHTLGHIDFAHFFNNFMLILLLGPMVEEKYGSLNLLLMLLFTAFITGVLHIILFNSILLGASGIVFFLILISSYANYQKGRIPLTLILVIVIFIGREIYAAFMNDDNIAQITHIAGAFIGALSGAFLNNKVNHKKASEKDMPSPLLVKPPVEEDEEI